MTDRREMDWLLFLTVVGMVSFGLVMVYSASSVVAEVQYEKPSYHFLVRQLIATGIAFAALMWLSQRDYRRFRSGPFAFTSLGIVVVLLIIVYFLDPRSHRWLRLGFTNLQPSEFAKPVLVVFLAWFVTTRAPEINNRHTLLPAGFALITLAGAVMVADLGTAVVLCATAAAVFFLAGLERKYIILAVFASILMTGAAVAARPYRVLRIIDHFDPKHEILMKFDPAGRILSYAQSGGAVRDAGYHARQSRIAVGTGGVFGLGLMQGKQKLLYLPEAHTDFIFAVVCEEMGFCTAVLLLFGYLVLLWRGYQLFWTARDDFGRYLALGVTTSLVFQALMNMSVVLDLAPTKGIPLPLISYGGSSLVSSLILLGLLLSVSQRRAAG